VTRVGRTSRRLGGPWLLVTASSVGASDSLRVTIWRRLRSLGALYLQQSACLLPARPEVKREVRRLLERVRAQGGSARIMTIRFEDAREEEAVIEEMRATSSTRSCSNECPPSSRN